MVKFSWQFARVVKVVMETPRVKTFTLQLTQWIPHLPGQHYDIRLTAEDGYQAERSYSIASAPEETGQIAITVELIEGGEVSTYLYESVVAGDLLEVRGPIGGYFAWRDDRKEVPLLLVGGGSGIVPLMAILRHRKKIGATNLTVLLYSVRTGEDVIYQSELSRLADGDPDFILNLTFTRQPPAGWNGYQRRIDRDMLTDMLKKFGTPPECFICGPTLLVENVANVLVNLGLPDDRVLTERFGPTGP